MKILVTGVAGFLGSHLAQKLSELGHDVVGVDNMIGGYKDNIPKELTVQKDINIPLEKKYKRISKAIEILIKTHTSLKLSELSEIFRGYLELRFNIPALESSTHELKGLLNNLKIKEKWFTNFFRNNDIVKFAKGIPSKKESVIFLDNIKDFIKKLGVSDEIFTEENKIID